MAALATGPDGGRSLVGYIELNTTPLTAPDLPRPQRQKAIRTAAGLARDAADLMLLLALLGLDPQEGR